MAKEVRVVSRGEWGASAPRGDGGRVAEPVVQVFIHTTVGVQLSRTASKEAEKQQVRNIQTTGFSRGFYDISYSFLVFPSGRVYEGRGWGVGQAATEGYNTSSYSIATAGNTDVHRPTWMQKRAIRRLINRGQRNGRISKVVNVRGHREVAPKACPGAKFTDAILARIQRRVNR